MGSVVPSLSPDGWLESIPAMADQLFADFIVASNSQYPFAKIDASLPWLIVKYQDDPSGLSEGVRQELLTYFQNNIPDATIKTSARTKDNPTKADQLDLYMGVQITKDGVVFEVANLIKVGEQRVLAVVKEANGSLNYE